MHDSIIIQYYIRLKVYFRKTTASSSSSARYSAVSLSVHCKVVPPFTTELSPPPLTLQGEIKQNLNCQSAAECAGDAVDIITPVVPFRGWCSLSLASATLGSTQRERQVHSTELPLSRLLILTSL